MQFQLGLEPGALENPAGGLCTVPAAGMRRCLGLQPRVSMEHTPESGPLPRTPVVFLQLQQQKFTSQVPSTEPDLPRWVMPCGTLG